MTMAQDPQSAGHDGLPRSAIATGEVDYVLPVERQVYISGLVAVPLNE
jgi:two-component system CheB/CheR fusion protein